MSSENFFSTKTCVLDLSVIKPPAFLKENQSRLFVPTFDTKVSEYLCSGWVFFLQTNFDFLTSNF